MLALLSFLFAILVLVLVHEYGHFQVARWLKVKVEEFGFGFPPAAYKRKIGETTYSLNWLPLGGFVRLKGEEETIHDPDSFSGQSPLRRAAIVLAGIIMNLLLAVVLFTVGYSIGLPQDLTESVPSHAVIRNVDHHIVDVIPSSPAATVLKAGDSVESLDGQSFNSYPALLTYIRNHDATPITVGYVRNGEHLTVPLATATISPAGSTPVRGLGVQLVTTGTVFYPLWYAPVAAVTEVARIVTLIAITLWALVVGLFAHATVSPEVTGPLGIAVLSGQVASLGVLAFLQFIAILSINLAFVNCLPLPALDGGRLLFIIIEWVRGRAVSRDLEIRIHAWGFTLLLALVAVVTVHDIGQYFGEQLTATWHALRAIL